jgi:hypothetical protein
MTAEHPGTPVAPLREQAEAAYMKACASSQAQDWMEAALLLRQALSAAPQSLNVAAQAPRSGESGDARHQVANQAPPPVAATPPQEPRDASPDSSSGHPTALRGNEPAVAATPIEKGADGLPWNAKRLWGDEPIDDQSL